jgi:hypothetical protein
MVVVSGSRQNLDRVYTDPGLQVETCAPSLYMLRSVMSAAQSDLASVGELQGFLIVRLMHSWRLMHAALLWCQLERFSSCNMQDSLALPQPAKTHCNATDRFRCPRLLQISFIARQRRLRSSTFCRIPAACSASWLSQLMHGASSSELLKMALL